MAEVWERGYMTSKVSESVYGHPVPRLPLVLARGAEPRVRRRVPGGDHRAVRVRPVAVHDGEHAVV